MALKEWLFGKEAQTQQVPTVTPQQSELLNQLLQGLQGPLSQGTNFISQLLQPQQGEEAFAAPAMRQFQQEIIPTIAERFAGMNALSSSGFQKALGSAGAQLAENLSAQRQQVGLQQSQQGLQALGQLQGLLGQGRAPQVSSIYSPETQGAIPELLNILLRLGGQYATGGLL